jgi:hypothetical protein
LPKKTPTAQQLRTVTVSIQTNFEIEELTLDFNATTEMKTIWRENIDFLVGRSVVRDTGTVNRIVSCGWNIFPALRVLWTCLIFYLSVRGATYSTGL